VVVPLVKNRDQVKDGIRRFNEELTRDAHDLASRLRYIRAWYYDPELDQVGPSKFIGYVGMTAKLYADLYARGLDGKETEPTLRQWFQTLEEGSPEEALVRARVEQLLARYGKKPNKKARFCGLVGWTASKKEPSPRSPSVRAARGRRTIHATIVRGENQYVAECEHLAIVTQGTTLDETLHNLKEAVELHLEDEDLEALGFAPDPVVVVTMEVQPWAA